MARLDSGKHLFRANLRKHVTVIVGGALVLTFLAIAALLVVRARETREERVRTLVSAANAISQTLDREVAGAHALLIGLSTSPALLSEDWPRFHEQLRVTPKPDGAWVVLSDKEKLLLHSLQPYGAKLPSLADFTPQPYFLERIESLGFALTGRVRGVLIDTVVVTANLKIPDGNSRLKYFLTTVISDKRFLTLLRSHIVPPNGEVRIYDHNLNGVVALSGDKPTLAPEMPGALKATLRDAWQEAGMKNVFGEGEGEHATAYRRSTNTGLIVTASLPAHVLDHEFNEIAWQLAAALAGLTVAGSVGFYYITRSVDPPLEKMEQSVVEAHQEIGALNARLLQVQEDEHQRIAGELHDSTAQHLVGAMLGLMNLENKIQDPDARASSGIIRQSVETALGELRTFSYLLHPRDLGARGLSVALDEFVRGFLRRAGIDGTIAIDPAIDAAPFDLQHSILRITQEALSNALRHAKPTGITVELRLTPESILLDIGNDGEIALSDRSAPKNTPEGVGIPSMRRRLIPFGGALALESSNGKTTVAAVIPRHLAMPV